MMTAGFLMVADLEQPSPEPFAVIEVFPDRPAEGGGCEGKVVSLHMDRAEAERVVASGPRVATLQ
jgi:hypothetical protein